MTYEKIHCIVKALTALTPSWISSRNRSQIYVGTLYFVISCMSTPPYLNEIKWPKFTSRYVCLNLIKKAIIAVDVFFLRLLHVPTHHKHWKWHHFPFSPVIIPHLARISRWNCTNCSATLGILLQIGNFLKCTMYNECDCVGREYLFAWEKFANKRMLR